MTTRTKCTKGDENIGVAKRGGVTLTWLEYPDGNGKHGGGRRKETTNYRGRIVYLLAVVESRFADVDGEAGSAV